MIGNMDKIDIYWSIIGYIFDEIYVCKVIQNYSYPISKSGIQYSYYLGLRATNDFVIALISCYCSSYSYDLAPIVKIAQYIGLVKY